MDANTLFVSIPAKATDNWQRLDNRWEYQLRSRQLSRDIWACTNDASGGIYRSRWDNISFNRIDAPEHPWTGVAVAPNGVVWAVESDGRVYTSVDGGAPFQLIHTAGYAFEDVAASPNGDIWFATWGNQRIYRLVGGELPFVQMAAIYYTNGVAIAPNLDAWAAVHAEFVYKSIGGTGAWNAISGYGTGVQWNDVEVDLNGDVWTIKGTVIYKNVAGTSGFSTYQDTAGVTWRSISAAINGDMWACEANGDIYYNAGGVSAFVPVGAETRQWRGISSQIYT